MVNSQERMNGLSQRELLVKRGTDAVDRISELPETLKENILERLPIDDAVRTSILSSDWRYAWTFRKRLDFGRTFLSLIDKYTGENYAGIINKILLLHHGPIEYVFLCIPASVKDDMLDLNAWLLNWSRKGIQELVINTFDYMKDEVKEFPIPSWLFQCQSLRSLVLMRCALKPPPDFCGFFDLVSLYLWDVTVPTNSLGIGTVISRCRKLEKLYVICKYSGFFHRGTPLIINAPNLRTLKFWDLNSGNIIFENVPHLSDVTLGRSVKILSDVPINRSEVYGSFDVLLSLRNIEKLDFELSLLETLKGDCPESLWVRFMNLKSLSLHFVRLSKRENIAFMFCLLRSAPNLKDLCVRIYQVPNHNQVLTEVSLQGLEVEGRRCNNLYKLVTMKIGFMKVRGNRKYDYAPMLKLIKILLSSCPVLETLYAAPHWQLELDAVKLDFVTKLLQFRRLSSNAEVLITD